MAALYRVHPSNGHFTITYMYPPSHDATAGQATHSPMHPGPVIPDSSMTGHHDHGYHDHIDPANSDALHVGHGADWMG